MQQLGIECNHGVCNCDIPGNVETGEAYCSDYCRNAEAGGEVESQSCACGHPQCDEF